jgi:hypothetical protein
MNQDDVIRMAREVIEERGGSRVDDEDELIAYSIQLAALVAAHEREECANLIPPQYYELRDRIRAKGSQA